MFKVEIETDDNAAFADGGWQAETARILHELASQLETGRFSNGLVLRDSSGNKVGQAWKESD